MAIRKSDETLEKMISGLIAKIEKVPPEKVTVEYIRQQRAARRKIQEAEQE